MIDQPTAESTPESESYEAGTNEAGTNFAAYVDHAAAMVGLPIPSDYRQSVIDNFARIAAIAPLVMDFPLPEDTEIAPIFHPES